MAFNFCQLFILLGLLVGVICVALLLGVPSLKRRSNKLLSLLMIAFIGNVAQYWLMDVGLISDNTMKLFFIPWQLLVAPFFLLYVYSLKVFNQYPYKSFLLFLPFAISLLVHLPIKVHIITSGGDVWTRPAWVSYFYLIEEVVSLLYCLIAALIVYRWIQMEKSKTAYNGFGVNREIVIWIKRMLQMGLLLALVWISLLYFVKQEILGFSAYYILWSLMVVVLNVLGIVGVYYSFREGRFTELNIGDDEVKSETTHSEKLQIVSPNKYLNDNKIHSIITLTSHLTKCNTIHGLQDGLGEWLRAEIKVESTNFLKSEESKGSEWNLIIPILGEGLGKSELVLGKMAGGRMDTSTMYYINMAVQAYNFHSRRVTAAEGKSKISSDSAVYRTLVSIVETEELFTDPKLDLKTLAQRLDVSSGYLSKVINDAGKKNFNEFINDYRIAKVKEIMSDPSFSHYTVTGYGLEAGFNSKSTFYKAFQKREGMSPGRYRLL